MRLFASRGYEQTSIEDVANAVGVLKGSLYYYIDSKEDLLYWVLRRIHEELREHVVGGYDSAGEGEPATAADQVAAFVARHLRYVLGHHDTSPLFVREFSVLDAVPHRREEILQLRREYEGQLVELVRRAQQDGDLGDQLDPALSARAVLAMCNAAHQWFVPDGKLAAEDIVSHHVHLALHGLGGRLPDIPGTS
jgi:AcrR family transcriptional regulator